MKKVFDSSYKITEYEVDPSWKRHMPRAYHQYRKKWDMASKGHLYPFPLCVEIESSYYCNLKCPACVRQILGGLESSGQMEPSLYSKILEEAAKNSMPSIMMDHEAEPLTNPRIAGMVADARKAGIIDIWMHTNANLLTEELSEKLIRGGLTKISFSIDATSEDVYDVVRPGGDYQRVIRNIEAFLRLKKRLKTDHIRTRVSFVVQEANNGQRKRFFDLWKDKVNLISFQDLIDFNKFSKDGHGPSKDAASRAFECFKTWQLLIVRYNGDVVPCGMPFHHYDKREYLLGNLYKDTIKSCWSSPIMNSIRRSHKKGDYHKVPYCRDCLVAYSKID